MTNNTYSCPECGMSFDSDSEREAHRQSVHQKESVPAPGERGEGIGRPTE